MNPIKNIAFENEFIVVDKKNTPVNFIEWEKTSKHLLSILKSRWFADLVENKSIRGELDACQIEIKNDGPHTSLSGAQDSPVPSLDYDPVHSWLDKKYQTIHDMLMWVSTATRKWTNIAGLHMHVQESTEFKNFTKTSNYVHDCLRAWAFDELLLSIDRHEHYATVVGWLQKLWFVQWNYMPLYFAPNDPVHERIIDEQWLPIDNYRYVQVKKPWENFTTEIRCADGAGNEESLFTSTQSLYELYLRAINK